MQQNLSQKLCHSGSACLILLILGLIYVPLGLSGQDEGEQNFYGKEKEGWFWYHDPASEPEEENQIGKPKQRQEPHLLEPENKYRNVDLEQYGMEDIWDMYPDDFQELLNHVQNLAVQNPIEKNVLRYQVIQDIARRKALAYTNASMFVNQKYGDIFNINQVYPTSKPGVTARVQMQNREIGETIAKAANTYALIYFSSPVCGFCEKQNFILYYFVEKYGWKVKLVDISKQPGTAARFGIETTPTLLLIKKGMEEYMTVSVGVVALTELERKLYRTIRYLDGKTKDANFLMYDFQKGSAFDATSVLKKESNQLWPQK